MFHRIIRGSPFCPDAKDLLRVSPPDFGIITTGIDIFIAVSLSEQTILKRSEVIVKRDMKLKLKNLIKRKKVKVTD